MTMAQSYYGGGEYESFYPSHYRAGLSASHFERASPYGYYDHPPRPLQGARHEYQGQPAARAMIHELNEPPASQQQQRKRIAVACSRCRKRKIKCSGDPGDGTGCSACKVMGPDTSQCAFMRVGAKDADDREVQDKLMPQIGNGMNGQPPSPTYSSDNSTMMGYATPNYRPQTRSSLVTLHTRSAFPTEYDAHYENSPMDTYNYMPSTISRHDSFPGAYASENFRSWSTTGPMSVTLPAPYYYQQQQPMYTMASTQASLYSQPQQPTSRISSFGVENLPALNMGHVNTSLPSQTTRGRHLPIPFPRPFTPTYPQSQPPAPPIRPLGSFPEPRVYSTGLQSHSRDSISWALENSTSTSRSQSIASLPPSTSTQSSATTAASEPGPGYQFTLAGGCTACSSPNISPTSRTAAPENQQTVPSSHNPSMLPPLGNPQDFAISASGLPSLYTFSTSDTPDRSTESVCGDEPSVWRGNEQQYHLHIRQLQPQHGSTLSQLRRLSSHSLDSERAGSTSHRMSLANLNTTMT